MKTVWFDINKLGYTWSERPKVSTRYIGPAIALTKEQYNNLFLIFLSYNVVEQVNNTLCFICSISEKQIKTIEVELDTKEARVYIDDITESISLRMKNYLREIENEESMV